MKRQSISALVAAVAVASSLSACVSADEQVTAKDTDQIISAEWIATDRGDVYCLRERTSYEYYVTDCQWDSLVAQGTHTTSSSIQMVGDWQSVEKGEVYCLRARTSYDYHVTDCDWSTLR